MKLENKSLKLLMFYMESNRESIMMNNFYELFHPEVKLQNKRLSGNDPCIDCTNIHRYHRGTALEAKILDKEKCKICIKKIQYDIDCMDKLRWYEDNDDKVSKMEKKDKNIYDCGVKCPKYLHGDTPILYPDGWY